MPTTQNYAYQTLISSYAVNDIPKKQRSGSISRRTLVHAATSNESGGRNTQLGCEAQVTQSPPAVDHLVTAARSMWDGSARDTTSPESDPAVAGRLANLYMFPKRLTYPKKRNLMSGGERLDPWLQGKDTSTTRTLTHSSRNSEVICARLSDGRTHDCPSPPEPAKTDIRLRQR